MIDFFTKIYYFGVMEANLWNKPINLIETYSCEIAKVLDFLGLENHESFLSGDGLDDLIKKLCVSKLCQVLGIRCAYSYKSPFFVFFSCLAADAIATKLNIKIGQAPCILRLIRYNNINLIEKAYEMLDDFDVDEYFIELFNLADKFKYQEVIKNEFGIR